MQQESVDGMLRNGTFDPTVQSWHSKIDMPTPNPHVLYCIREIKNFPELGYCYVTVLVDRAGEPYEQILFYNYVPIQGYSRFVEDIKNFVPLHCSCIKDYLVTFHRTEKCPCGWECEQSYDDKALISGRNFQ